MATSTPSASQQGSAPAPAQLPGVDMSALLQGISPEQLAVIGHLFQTGQLQLPPQPPQAVVPAPAQNARPTTEGANGVKPTSNGHANGTAADKEEGEWDDDDMDMSGQRDFLHPPPTGPRKRSPPATDRRRRQSDGKHRVQKPGVSRPSPLTSARVSASRQARRDAAKTFILAVHEAGFTFEDLATEVNSPRLLGILYHELGLGIAPARKLEANIAAATRPVHQVTPTSSPKAAIPASASLPQPAATAPSTADSIVSAKPPPAGTTPTALSKAASATKKPPPIKAAEPGDRSAYLARLQALKTKTAAPASKANAPAMVSPQPALSSNIKPPAAEVLAKQAPSATASIPTATPELLMPPATGSNPVTVPAESRPKVAINPELVKQRLAAFKEAQARKNGSVTTPGSALPSPHTGGASVSATYNAVEQAVQAAAPGLSAQQVQDAVENIALQAAQHAPLPTPVTQDGPSSSAMRHTHIQSQSQQQPSAPPPLANLPVYSPSGLSYPGLPGLYMSGSPFDNGSSMRLPGLPPPSAPPTQSSFSAQPATNSTPGPVPTRITSAAPSNYDSDSSSHLNSIFSPSDPGNSISVGASVAGVKRGADAESTYPSKRLFGKPVLDRVIIDNSDEEGEVDDEDESEFDDDDMDLDDGNAATSTNAPTTLVGNGNGQNAAHPSTIVLPSPGGFVQGIVSGNSTPGGTAYHRKLLEIQEIKQQLELKQAQRAKVRGSSTPLQKSMTTATTTTATAQPDITANGPNSDVPAPLSATAVANTLNDADGPLEKLSDSSTADEMDVSSEEDGEIGEMATGERDNAGVIDETTSDDHFVTALVAQDDPNSVDHEDGEVAGAHVRDQPAHPLTHPEDEDSSSDASFDGEIDEQTAAAPPAGARDAPDNVDTSDASSIDDSDAEMYGTTQPPAMPSSRPTDVASTQSLPGSVAAPPGGAEIFSSEEESEDEYDPEEEHEAIVVQNATVASEIISAEPIRSASDQHAFPPPVTNTPVGVKDDAKAGGDIMTKREEDKMKRAKRIEEEWAAEEVRKARMAAKLAELSNMGMSRQEREETAAPDKFAAREPGGMQPSTSAASTGSVAPIDQVASQTGGVSSSQASEVATNGEVSALTYEPDSAPELQPGRDEQIDEAHEEPDEQPLSRYTPYRTPLARFKNFRYHPEYHAYVSGGHKSLTYNNKIKEGLAFCATELDGKECKKTNCEYQHFRDIAYNDADLLREYGTNNIPAGTPDAAQRWRQGLGDVVKQLRGTPMGKDVNAIAGAIVQFRRDFINAPDKVLDLGL